MLFIQSDNIDDYLGKFSGYYTILDKFVEMHKNDFNGDVNAMVKGTLYSCLIIPK